MSTIELPPTPTLRDARVYVSNGAENGGVTCPCCDQFSKTYRRRLTPSMCRKLIAMDRIHAGEWFHLPLLMRELRFASRDEGLLGYFGLIEQMTEHPTFGHRKGWWRVTARGARFVRNQITVPRYALVYNGRLQGFDDPQDRVSIVDALGSRFDYRAEMVASAALESAVVPEDRPGHGNGTDHQQDNGGKAEDGQVG